MKDIVRQRHTLKKYDSLLEEVYESLKLFDDPIVRCKTFKRFSEGVTVSYCVISCSNKCKFFKSLSFIVQNCNDLDCNEEYPCRYCLDEVSRYKVLILAIQCLKLNKIKSLSRVSKYQSRKK